MEHPLSFAVCRDICDWYAFPAYDVLYTDPPWEDRMVRFFQTTMLKQSGRTVDHTIGDLLGCLFDLADTAKPVMVEYSVAGAERVVDAAVSSGHVHTGSHPAVQSNGKPYLVLAFNAAVDIPPGTKGFAAVDVVLSQLRPRVVFDPFAGIGATARAVLRRKVAYIGGEVNPARFKRLLAVIDRCGGL